VRLLESADTKRGQETGLLLSLPARLAWRGRGKKKGTDALRALQGTVDAVSR